MSAQRILDDVEIVRARDTAPAARSSDRCSPCGGRVTRSRNRFTAAMLSASASFHRAIKRDTSSSRATSTGDGCGMRGSSAAGLRAVIENASFVGPPQPV